MEEHHPEGFREFGMDPDLYNEELLEEQQLHQLCFCKFGMDPDVYKAQVINKVIQDLRGLDPDATENTLNHVRTTIETVQTFSEDFFLVPKAVVLLHRFINGLSVQQMTLNVWFKNMTVAETAKNKAEQYGLPSLLFTVFVRYLLEMGEQDWWRHQDHAPWLFDKDLGQIEIAIVAKMWFRVVVTREQVRQLLRTMCD
jgi:hypothetical protein